MNDVVIPDRFNSDERDDLDRRRENSDEFKNGAKDRRLGILRHKNPYYCKEGQRTIKSSDWDAGWCDEDMIIMAKDRGEFWDEIGCAFCSLHRACMRLGKHFRKLYRMVKEIEV